MNSANGTRGSLLAAALGATALGIQGLARTQRLPEVTVNKCPACDCCNEWGRAPQSLPTIWAETALRGEGKMQIRIKTLMLSLLAIAASDVPALAQQSDHASHHGAAQIAQAAVLSEGEVRKVDKDARKITIKHGPLENLDMPAMTMVFQVKDSAMLDSVKAGDKVKFRAENIGGAFTVTRIEAAK